MRISQTIKQKAFEGLVHFQPKKPLARNLGISPGSLRDWSIYIQHGFFDWLHVNYVEQRKVLLGKAVDYWFDKYPIGFMDVAREFGIRPATLYTAIKRRVGKLPEQLRPTRIRYWDDAKDNHPRRPVMAIDSLEDIPANRPLTLEERKELFKELKEARCRMACCESMLEVAIKSCKDELKKKS